MYILKPNLTCHYTWICIKLCLYNLYRLLPFPYNQTYTDYCFFKCQLLKRNQNILIINSCPLASSFFPPSFSLLSPSQSIRPHLLTVGTPQATLTEEEQYCRHKHLLTFFKVVLFLFMQVHFWADMIHPTYLPHV